MKKELSNFDGYLNLNVKIFPKERAEPITGKVTAINKKFLILLAKKANRRENKIMYVGRSIKKDNVERISLI